MEQLKSLAQSIADALGPYGPRAAGAAAILALAWLGAGIARGAAQRIAGATSLEERLKSPGLGATLGNLAYGLVWLFALPALLDTLHLDGLLAPVNAMMARLFSFLPGLFGGVVVLAVGLLAGRILRQVVTGMLMALGSERLAARVGLSQALGDKTLAGVAGSVVYALVLLPTLAAATQAIGLEAISRPIGNLLDTVMALIPKLISAAILVIVGAVLGRMAAGLVTTLLAGLGLNRLPAQLGLDQSLRLGGRDLAELAGTAVMTGILLLTLTQAFDILGFGVLSGAVATLGEILVRLLVAVIVFGVGFWLATLSARAIEGSAIARAREVGQGARAAILFFAAALALRQTGLPGDIIAVAFGAVVGGLALGVALAIGLGGRKVAARLLEELAASFEKRPDPAVRPAVEVAPRAPAAASTSGDPARPDGQG